MNNSLESNQSTNNKFYSACCWSSSASPLTCTIWSFMCHVQDRVHKFWIIFITGDKKRSNWYLRTKVTWSCIFLQIKFLYSKTITCLLINSRPSSVCQKEGLRPSLLLYRCGNVLKMIKLRRWSWASNQETKMILKF